MPSIKEGDMLVSIRLPWFFIREGARVIVRTDEDGDIVKRVDRKNKNGLVLKSDNPDTTSRYCGTELPKSRVQSLILCNFS